MAYNEARLTYHAALKAYDDAVQRNVDSWTCGACRAHYDKHSRNGLACPAYTKGDVVVFSDTHKYTEPA
jgi:hypothetical protein